MKIAIFYPKNLYASWMTLGGYRQTLERMGHTVLVGEFPGNLIQSLDAVRAALPTIEELNDCDCIISAFHEYSQPWLEQLYGWEAWSKLKTPVIARFDESMDRVDLKLPARVPELLKWAHYYSFPAAQDADRFKGQWLPFGADTTMFKPWVREGFGDMPWDIALSHKKYPLGFIGSAYPMRTNYLQKLAEVIPNDIEFHWRPVLIQDLSGIHPVATTELLAENYRQIKVFFCLPPMSRLMVAKVFEVMATGTFMMYPRLPGDASKNTEIFKHGEHLVYYDGGHLKKNASQILHFLENDKEREEIAARGRDLVRSEFTLEKMLEKLLEPVWSVKRDRLVDNLMEFKRPMEATA